MITPPSTDDSGTGPSAPQVSGPNLLMAVAIMDQMGRFEQPAKPGPARTQRGRGRSSGHSKSLGATGGNGAQR